MMAMKLSSQVIRTLLLFSSSCFYYQLLAASKVEITKTEFQNPGAKFIQLGESDVALLLEAKTKTLFRSEDEGKSWKKVDGLLDGSLEGIYRHPVSQEKVLVVTDQKKHYASSDSGKSWASFDVEVPPAWGGSIFSFHHHRPSYVIYMGTDCPKTHHSQDSADCRDIAYYTMDFFKSPPIKLVDNISTCSWAHAGEHFQNTPTNTIFCIWKDGPADSISKAIEKSKLSYSEDFFKTQNLVDFDFDGKPDGGVIGFTLASKFIVAAVKRNVAEDALTLFVSEEGRVWAEAHIPLHSSLKHNAFTILESTRNFLVLNVVSTNSDAFGTLFLSNSNGTYFTPSLSHTNRDHAGIVDYEQVHGLKGVIMTNIVSNWETIEKTDPYAEKALQSQITFNNGASWNYLNPPNEDCDAKKYHCVENKKSLPECALHLHSITTPHNIGRIYSSESSTGFLIGVGNVGSHLEHYADSDTFLSTDGGLSWKCAQSGPHKYALGDMGSLLVLVPDRKQVDKIVYSYDQGLVWNQESIGVSIKPSFLTTEKKSTSQAMVLAGKTDNEKSLMFHLDFSKVHPRKCVLDLNNPNNNKDFELWYPKLPSDFHKDTCVMGEKTGYWRRKSQVECYVGEKFKIPEVKVEYCPCTRSDFECDYSYMLDEDFKCKLVGEEVVPRDSCVDGKSTYLGSSGYRKIPENMCDPKLSGSQVFDKPVEKSCKGNEFHGSPGDVSHVRKEIKDTIYKYYFFPKSTAIIMLTSRGEIWTSPNMGQDWHLKSSEKAIKIIGHPYDSQRAYIIFAENRMHVTKDQGASFQTIKLPLKPNILGLEPILNFHFGKTDSLIFMAGTDCPSCHSEAFLTKDNGGSWDSICTFVRQCIFGDSDKFKGIDENAIYCTRYVKTDASQDQQTLEKNGPFNNDNFLELVRFVNKQSKVLLSHVGDLYISGHHMVASKIENSHVIIKVSINGDTFQDAAFPPNLRTIKDSFALIDASDLHHTLFLALLKVDFRNSTQPSFGESQFPIGSLFVSDYNGTFFTLSLPNIHTSVLGAVDIEHVYGIDGISIANQMSGLDNNGNAISKTVITFDNGASWQPLKAPEKDHVGKAYSCDTEKCSLHLQGAFHQRAGSTSFGTPSSIGTIMAVGNVGTTLASYEDSNTYLSRDGGLSWKEIRVGESLYLICDSGALLIMVDDEGPTNFLWYSVDGGDKWSRYSFSDDAVRVTKLITAMQHDVLQVILFAFGSDQNDPNQHGLPHSQIISIDFRKVLPRQCKMDKNSPANSDFEQWTAQRPTFRTSKDLTKSELTKCLLGRKISYWVRKQTSNCYIGDSMKDVTPDIESCECTELDYECDVNYWRSDQNNGECYLYGRDPDRPANCKTGETYTGKSGYRKIPASICHGGKKLDGQVQKKCTEINGVAMKETTFDSNMEEYFYFKQSERIVIRTASGLIWSSQNEGLTWTRLFSDQKDKFLSMIHHPFVDDTAYFITSGQTHYFTHDETRTLTAIKTPTKPNTFNIPVFSFHPQKSEWVIFVGMKDCDNSFSPNCRTEAFVTQDSGKTWKDLGDYVRNCGWSRTDHYQKVPVNRIYCERYKRRSGSQKGFINEALAMVQSDDEFRNEKVLFENIVGYSIFHEFLVVAMSSTNSGKGGVALQISIDGTAFHEAKYPPQVGATHDGFTVLQSDTHSLFLHITTEAGVNQESGPLLNSNSNGTYFVTSLDHVNRDRQGFVDFEKMEGIRGIAIANQISNPEEMKISHRKTVVSKITFNNGVSWTSLNRPSKDADGNDYQCTSSKVCTLHLHGFTERSDPVNIFSASSAIGLMVGVGNVGSELLAITDGNTYITRDAGHTWKEVKKGRYQHEIGDQGALILLIEEGKETDHLWYSTDEGNSFQQLNLQTQTQAIQMKITEITTEPQSTSLKFVLFGHASSNQNKFMALQVDFSGLHERQCVLDKDDQAKSDFEEWSPVLGEGSSTTSGQCLFGQEIQFHRKIPEHKCYIGKKYEEPEPTKKSCLCTKNDFECDYNFMKDDQGTCHVVPGYQPLKSNSCDQGETTYRISTGYRKVPMSQCQGGEELDVGAEEWCPGHGTSKWLIFFVVVIPILALCYFIWIIMSKQNIPLARLLKESLKMIGGFLILLPATVVQCLRGGVGKVRRGGSSAAAGIPGLGRFGSRFSRAQPGYAPVAQYDFEDDDDAYLNDGSEVQLEDYDADTLPSSINHQSNIHNDNDDIIINDRDNDDDNENTRLV